MTTQKPMEIIVTEENKNEFIGIYITIRSFTDKDLDVPSPHVKRFFELMYNAGEYKMDQLFKKARDFSAIAAEKIKSTKDYQFNWQDTVFPENDIVIKNDTAKVFLELIYAFFLFKEDHIKADKDDAIAFFYQAFDENYKNKIELNDQENFTPYKQAVISGILAMAIEFQLTTKPDPTNEEIFQATRNAIKKYLKEE
jgi:hypothetical protein